MARVAIVGRPNVGKSTLFNRLAGRRIAIVGDVPGLTRDRLQAEVHWRGRCFTLIDTGGLPPDPDAPLAREVARQIAVATQEADAVILLVDAREGVTPGDVELAERVRRTGKPVVLAANKVDSPAAAPAAAEFYRLGLGDPLPISAQHGLGVGELLDRVLAVLPPDEPRDALREEAAEPIRVAIVGRPNVGKSSLLNRLVGEDRVIVSELPGTTRDAVDVVWDGPIGRVVFIDTAGLRRPSRVREEVEFYSAARARRAVERADVAVVVFDATEMVTDQDKRVAGMVAERGRAAVVAVNKWDLVEGHGTPEQARQVVHTALPLLDYVEVVCCSARTGLGMDALLGAIARAYRSFRKTVQTAQLNRILQDAVADHAPPSVGGRRLKVRYGTQVRAGPPTFLVFVNDPELVVEHYRRYLENRLRAALDLTGTPLRLVFRASR